MARFIIIIVPAIMMIAIGMFNSFAFISWMGVGLLLFTCLLMFFVSSKNSAKLNQGKEWTERFPSARYSFGHGEYGIAVEDQAEKIHLMDSGQVKSYQFADVRSWKTNLQTGGTTAFVGGGALNAMSVGSANSKQLKDNEKASGLFVSVRDVDKPIWRIKFSDKQDEEERQQARWMEILNQVVNKA